MKTLKKTNGAKNQRHVNVFDGIVNIRAFSKKDIESIKNGDSFVRVPTQELNDLRVPVYSFLI